MSAFVTKENIHEATDVKKINNLLANAERLGEADLVNKCKSRLEALRHKVRKNNNKSGLTVSERSVIEALQNRNNNDLRNFLSQEVLVKKRNFERYGGKFEKLFGQSDKITISRKNVFDWMETDITSGMLAAVAWGFQKGTRPGGKTLAPFLNHFEEIKSTLDNILQFGLNKDLFEELNAHKEVKNGITSKLLYFSKATVNSCPCLIYDSRVKAYLEAVAPKEFPLSLSAMKKSQPVPSFDLYDNFCKEALACAQSVNLQSGAIEMYMFTNAPGKRQAQHIVKI